MPFIGVALGIPQTGAVKAQAGITLSNTSVLDSASVGDAIGTFAVANGSGGTYTFTLTDDHGGHYTVTSPTLKVGATLTGPATESITAHADDGGGSVLDHTFSINVLHVGTYTPTYYFLGF